MKNLLLCLLLLLTISVGAQASDYVSVATTNIPYTGVCDGIADDGPAIEAALENITAPGGSHKLNLPSSGTCKIATPVTNSFDNTHDIIVEGSGSGSTLLLATGNLNAFNLGAAYSIAWFNVTFSGTARASSDPNYSAPDANIGLSFGYVLHLSFDKCQFYGTFTPGGMIRTDNTNLLFTNNKVRGSTTSTGGPFGAIYMHKWIGGVIKGNTFLDYGNLNGVYHSKTPISSTISWVLAEEPAGEINKEVIGTQLSESNAYSQATLVVTDNFFDEGAYRAVHVESNIAIGKPWTARVHVARNNMNAAGVSGALGYYFQNIRDLFIDQVYVGYAYAMDVPGIYLNNVMHTTIKGSFFMQRAATIVTRGPGELVLENTKYKVLDTDGGTAVRLLQEGKRINRTPSAGIHTYDNLTALASNVETIYGAPVATAEELVPTGNVFHVYGSGTISGISSNRIEPGTSFTLIFGEGSPVVNGGVNLNIASGFTARPGDTLSLVYSDSVFHETARRSKQSQHKFVY